MGALEPAMALRKVEVHVTDACSNRCVFCSTGHALAAGEPPPADVTRGAIRGQLEEAFAQGCRRVLFQGGEPTLRADLAELLADAREIGYQATTVFTNARAAASAGGARRLAALGVTWFQASLHAGTPAAHDAAVGLAGAFAQTVEGVRRLLDAGQRVKVNSVLTRHLLDTLPAYASLIATIRPEEVGLDALKPGGHLAEPARYAGLCPALARHAVQLRDAILTMARAGTPARLVAVPPCLVPGAEAYATEEAPTTLTLCAGGEALDKHRWRRGLMVKGPGCAACACDATCGGVYRAYAEAHGLGELRPLAARPPPAPGREIPLARTESPLALALRRRLVVGGGIVHAVRQRADGVLELEAGPIEAPVVLLLGARGDGPAYATTARFSVRYRNPPAGAAVDLRLVEAAVRALRQAEGALGEV